MPSPQARYWILTIPEDRWEPCLPDGVEYVKGQKECGHATGYLHWQLIAYFKHNTTLYRVKRIFGDNIRAERTRSEAAEDYVWKEDTRVEGTQFEFGVKSFKRNNKTDWDKALQSAKSGVFEEIPPDVVIRCYGNLKRIYVDNLKPVAEEKCTHVFWGATGTGKSKRAWEEATLEAYPKGPTSIWWCGYAGHENVVIDEFRGSIGISHMLRWLDRYPVVVEVKGSSVVLKAKKIWITSNLHPRDLS